MLKVLAIVGTRPEAIKMAPIVRELTRRPAEFAVVVCATGQHRDMLTRALTMVGVTADVQLDAMVPDQELAGLTGRLLDLVDPVIADQRPDWVLVQGDTTTAMVGALAAFYRRVRVGHVEAGLRTGDLTQPFPEELNRRVADLSADLCFAPTELARANLLREGIAPSRIHVTGNTIVDAVKAIAAAPYDVARGPLATVPSEPRWVLVTTHRRESFGAPLQRICAAVDQICRRFGEEIHVILPAHPNPNVMDTVSRLAAHGNCSVVPPLDYPDLLYVLRRASLVLTDSGGIQEEAPTFGVPVLVLRDKTERPEGIAAGIARLGGTDTDLIVAEAIRWLGEKKPDIAATNPYGDGRAARRIVALLARHSGLTVPDPDDALTPELSGSR